MTSEMPAYRPSVSSGSEPSFTQVMAMSDPPRPAAARQPETGNPFAGFDRASQRPPDPSPSAPPIGSERPPQKNLLAGGEGMTQMLRRLEVPPAPAAYPPTQFTQAYVDPPSKPATPGPNTSFSGLYKSLGGDAEPRSGQPATPPAPAARNSSFFEPAPTPAMPQNPPQPARGEVTTILEMSKLREMQRQGASAAAAPQGGPSTMPPWAPQMPAAPAMPQPAPALPQPPQFAPPQYTPPAVNVQPPAPAAPTAPKGGMQQYIPLFLIAIIFLLVVILITVVFLLKH
jgi:hypothetical protein